jgi:archaellum component FlaC
MNAKIEKIDQEIGKTEKRIKQLQDKLTELREKREELEKTEIVDMVRSVSATPEQLAVFIQSFKHQAQLDLEAEPEEVFDEEA